VLAGIFVGEEIYCTGGVHTPIRKSGYNIFMGDKFSGASSGYGPRLPINLSRLYDAAFVLVVFASQTLSPRPMQDSLPVTRQVFWIERFVVNFPLFHFYVFILSSAGYSVSLFMFPKKPFIRS
jgi:hypothetical protein